MLDICRLVARHYVGWNEVILTNVRTAKFSADYQQTLVRQNGPLSMPTNSTRLLYSFFLANPDWLRHRDTQIDTASDSFDWLRNSTVSAHCDRQ